MTRRKSPQQLNGGWQMDLFAAEPEPAPVAGPARPEVADWAAAHGLQLHTGTAGTAVLSPCGTYRYRLDRVWDEQAAPLVWVMLNPSTADADENDPTIRRCVQFAKDAGCGGITVVNLFALRATDPAQLRQHADPVGPMNEAALDTAAEGVRIVAAWGDTTRPVRAARARTVAAQLAAHGRALECLGLTGKGHPRHPLYVRSDTALVPYTPPAEELSPIGDTAGEAARTLEPMSAAAVAWIAQHVIADYHLANEKSWWCDPDQNWEPQCRCQFPCPLCRAGRHDRCRELRQTQQTATHGPYAPTPETHLRVPAPHSAQRPRTLYVPVWLADRACRSLCDCPQCADQRLGCWCAEGAPCHARVLAERADREVVR
ncbi:DUF1643 domain-containing protein [Streptomyces cucumeris]|uniref:DUF1643 domain-containing protein n=1 Tax=Streptomyces cucumeris TaxID=2962890 RepID=UPI003D714117